MRIARAGLAGLAVAGALLGATAAYFVAAPARGAAPERIALSASKFAFSAQEIRVRKGRPVTIVLSTPDFPHGFALPDFNVRADAVPGKALEVTFTPGKAGRFVFLCDNFCGEGHDRMTGFLVVTEN